jgi:hypothetical protein
VTSGHYIKVNARFARFGTAAVRDALVGMSKYASTPDSVQSLSRAFYNVSRGPVAIAVFGTAAVRVALLTMSIYALTPDSVEWLSNAISNIPCNDDAAVKAVNGAAAVRDALIAMVA